MPTPQTASDFVRSFHRDLSAWFSGSGARDDVWARLLEATPSDMTLVYPSGARLHGSDFLASIRDRFGTSPGFVATISDIEVLRADDDHAVLAYVESQHGATHSETINRRSALALIDRVDGRWRWHFIQETAIPET